MSVTVDAVVRSTALPVDDITRRGLLAGGAAVGLLSACARGDQTTGAATAPTKASGDGAPSTRSATRVAALDPRTMDILVALNVPVVAAQPAGTGLGVPKYLGERARSDIEIVGDGGEINLEELAAATPDLIIGTGDFAKIRDQLDRIAPVRAYDSALFTDQGAVDWRTDIRAVGSILGRRDDADGLVTMLEARFAQTKRLIGPKQGAGIAVMRVYGAEGFRLYGPGSVPAVVADDAGLVLAPLPDEPEAGRFLVDFSQERVLDVAAEHIFVSIGSFDEPGTDAEFALLDSSPLWKKVPAVRAGKVARIVDVSAWFIGGPIGWQVMLDEVETYFDSR
jgi:iron complex transport system substrate-binding protein